jgi:galactokinase
MIDGFRRLYGSADGLRVYRAPGRVNLIGEHTDYNLGFVLPMALQMATFVGTAPAGDGKLRVYSESRGESAEWSVSEIGGLRPEQHWTDYFIGVAQEFLRAGFEIAPANLLIHSMVPEGSGLSSSAALEVSSALALLNGRAMEPLAIARLCQASEWNFVGIPCGIMDQYISVFGVEGSAVCIDCRSLTHQVTPLPDGIAFVAVNTMVKHELASSAYKERTRQCAAAVAAIRSRFAHVESLRDVTPAMYEELEPLLDPLLDPLIARRARHVVSEDTRVEQFMAASAEGDVARMGELLIESHRSLQHDYEVSCDELDFLVDAALGIRGVYGARMTGGGFGGCTVNMMRSGAVDDFQREIGRLYHQRYGVQPGVYTCLAARGAAEVKDIESIFGAGH